MNAKLIVTGFGPFGRHQNNVSELVVRLLASSQRAAHLIAATAILPVEFDTCYEALRPVLRSTPHDAVVCFGQHGVATAILIERFARNRENLGPGAPGFPGSRVIREDAPSLIQTGLPVDLILERLSRGGFPGNASEDAGGYVCNNLFFHLMSDETRGCMPAGFIHLPLIDGQRWTEDRLVGAAEEIILAVAEP